MKSNYFINTKIFDLRLILLFLGLILNSEILFADTHSKTANTDYVVEYSLLGLKNSAQQMADRNAWLVAQINQIKDQAPALQQRLTILESEKEKLQVLSADNTSARTLKKYVSESKKGSVGLQDRTSLILDKETLEQKIHLEEIENQKLKENTKSVEDEVSKLQYELSLLNTEVKNNHEKDAWQDLVQQKEQNLKSLRNAQRTLSELEGSHNKPLSQVRSLELEQKNLQNRLGQLENEMNVSFNQDNDLKQQILNVRGQHAQKMTQLNQEVDQLKQRLKEMEDTLAQARTKIKEKNISLNAGNYNDEDLKHNLNFMNQENLALKSEISSLKETLDKIESIK